MTLRLLPTPKVSSDLRYKQNNDVTTDCLFFLIASFAITKQLCARLGTLGTYLTISLLSLISHLCTSSHFCNVEHLPS